MKRASMKFTKGESGLYEKQEAEVSSLISKHEIKDLLEDFYPRREERWAADQSMCEEMTKMDVTIRAYISIPFREEEPLGEWYNLVLFDDLAFIDTFEKSELHKFAKKSLSPDSFTHVSVRRGVVQNSDDLSGAIHLHVTRSVMITYGADGGMERKVFNENDCSD